MFTNKHNTTKYKNPAITAVLCIVFIAVFAQNTYAISGLTQEIKDFAQTICGLVIGVGAIRFGIGWTSDNDESKVQGLQTMIAGGIMFWLAGLTFYGAGAMTAGLATRLRILGGVTTGIGAVFFGLGFTSETAEQKVRGIKTMIGGAIITAAVSLM